MTEITGTAEIARPPQVGDVGTIVHVYSDTTVSVECVEGEGLTLWLADFRLGELAHVAAVAGTTGRRGIGPSGQPSVRFFAPWLPRVMLGPSRGCDR